MGTLGTMALYIYIFANTYKLLIINKIYDKDSACRVYIYIAGNQSERALYNFYHINIYGILQAQETSYQHSLSIEYSSFFSFDILGPGCTLTIRAVKDAVGFAFLDLGGWS